LVGRTGGVEVAVARCVVGEAGWGDAVGVVEGATVGLVADGRGELAVSCALADAAADDDCAATIWVTAFGERTCGCAPVTSWPTRSTAVSVTAVMRAHDTSQPTARPSGRPVQRAARPAPSSRRPLPEGAPRRGGGGG
jgi:hypothetical protein